MPAPSVQFALVRPFTSVTPRVGVIVPPPGYLAALREPDARSALMLTLLVAAIAVIAQAN